jgi:hypothetical protein
MRTLPTLLLVGILGLGTVVAVRGDEEGLKSGPQPGTRARPTHIPGTFQIWMVGGPLVTKETGKRYHSPVCEHSTNPVCFVFVREFDPEDKALVGLVKKLDTLAAKHPDARFGCVLVILDDGGFRDVLQKEEDDLPKRLAETGAAKENLENKLKEMAEAEKLSSITLALDTKAGPKGYQLNEEAQVTILLYNKHIVLENWAFKEKLKDEDVDRIYAPVEKIVLEVERLSRPEYRNKVIKK